MGSALLNGIMGLSAESFTKVCVYDSYPASAVQLSQAYDSIEVSENVSQLVSESNIILLCVKPNNVAEVLQAVENWNGKLLLSIAAGITTGFLSSNTNGEAAIIRVMPNTPAMIGEGASAFCPGPNASAEDCDLAAQLLSAVGTVSQVTEVQMDAVTGLSGSGPAYVYTIIEALADAGVKQGLSREVALQLSCQTVKGASLLVEETGLHPAVLRDQVTSPGGTTIAGLAKLEEKGLRSALISAVEAATVRSKELG